MKSKKPRRGTASAVPSIRAKSPRPPAQSKVIDLVPAVLRIATILVPVDFSPPSELALRYATAFARQFGARLVLLHVIEPLAGPDFAYFPLVQARGQLVAGARQRLDKLARESADTPSMFARPLVREGKAHHVITEAARRLHVNLIILATHGYTGAARVILGSTAERVVRHAPCPVLVVREGQVEFA